MKTDLKVSIVVPCRDSEISLGTAIKAMINMNPSAHEIILVDDGSRSPLSESLGISGVVKHIRLSENRGPAFARNTGADSATGDIILFLDADVVPEQDLLSHILKNFETEQSISAVQGVYTQNCPDARLFSQYQNLYYHFVFKRLGKTDSAICATYCFAVRKSIFKDMGGFDSDVQKPTVEDELFGYQMAAAGYKIRLAPECQVTHLAGYSVVQFMRRKFRMSFNQIKSLLRGNKPPIAATLESTNKTHHPRGILFSVLLAPILLPVWLMNLWAGISILILYVIGNSGFWGYILRTQGWQKYAPMIAATWLDQTVIFSGLMCGAMHYFIGHRY